MIRQKQNKDIFKLIEYFELQLRLTTYQQRLTKYHQNELSEYRLYCISLKSNSHVSENFCQIKIFYSLVRKNTIICLFGV